VNKKQLVLAVLLCGMIILSTSCFFRKTNAPKAIEFGFHAGEFRLPFLEVEIDGKAYQTDEQGRLFVEREPEGFCFAGPWEVERIEKEPDRLEVHLQFAEKPFVGLIFLEKGGAFFAELLSLNQEQLKAVELVVEGVSLVPAQTREIVEPFGRRAVLVKGRGGSNVLEMDESEGSTMRKMYGVLGNSDGNLPFARFEVPVESLPLKDFRITAVDGNGQLIEEQARGSLEK